MITLYGDRKWIQARAGPSGLVTGQRALGLRRPSKIIGDGSLSKRITRQAEKDQRIDDKQTSKKKFHIRLRFRLL